MRTLETHHPVIRLVGQSLPHQKLNGETDITLVVIDVTPVWTMRCDGMSGRFHYDLFHCVDVPTADARPETAWGKTGSYGIKSDELTELLVERLGWSRRHAAYYVASLSVMSEHYHMAVTTR